MSHVPITQLTSKDPETSMHMEVSVTFGPRCRRFRLHPHSAMFVRADSDDCSKNSNDSGFNV